MQRLLKSGTVGQRLTVRRTSTKDSSATARIKPNEICCHRLEARLLADCSGGNSRLSYLLRCGGRSFFNQENRMTDTYAALWGSNRHAAPRASRRPGASFDCGLSVERCDRCLGAFRRAGLCRPWHLFSVSDPGL
jgi:hypothetical protein